MLLDLWPLLDQQPTSGHSVRRVVVDRWIPDDIYRETKVHLVVETTCDWWIEASTEATLGLVASGESRIEGATLADLTFAMTAASTVEATTRRECVSTVTTDHGFYDLYDLLDL